MYGLLDLGLLIEIDLNLSVILYRLPNTKSTVFRLRWKGKDAMDTTIFALHRVSLWVKTQAQCIEHSFNKLISEDKMKTRVGNWRRCGLNLVLNLVLQITGFDPMI